MDIRVSIKQAREQIEIAKNRLDNALSDDEIDSAIAEMKAAELNYNRLIRLAKKERKAS